MRAEYILLSLVTKFVNDSVTVLTEHSFIEVVVFVSIHDLRGDRHSSDIINAVCMHACTIHLPRLECFHAKNDASNHPANPRTYHGGL